MTYRWKHECGDSRQFQRMCRLFTLVGLCLIPSGTILAAASFQGLGDLPGGDIHSIASAISADGLVVVGSSTTASGTEAFRWSLTDGLIGLGDLSGGGFTSQATDVSADGTVIVGSGNSDSGPEAFRWVQGIGMVALGDLPGGQFMSTAQGVSADGTTVVGTGTPALGTSEAFVWTITDGMTGLGKLASSPFQESSATDITADGLMVVGTSLSGVGSQKALRWTSATGMIELEGTHDFSSAYAVSSDGHFVVGRASFATSQEAFLWTNSEGVLGLGYLSTSGDFISSTALAVSIGGTAVGKSQIDLTSTAFLWDHAHGMRELQTVLTDLGLDLTGWTLTEATGISDDGLTIVGTGINPDGNTEAFIARLPEPTSAAVLAAAALGILGHRRMFQVTRDDGSSHTSNEPRA